MSEFPWLRLYNETLTDRKLLRVCRQSGQPKALILGVWATLLMLASESPERGALLISEGLAFTPDEILDETELDSDTFNSIIEQLEYVGMLDTSGECWFICNWHKRQPNSDSSTERVRKHRQKKQEETPPVLIETLPKRSGNVIDKELDQDTDKEGEGEKSGAFAPAASPPPSPSFQSVPEEVQRAKKQRGESSPEAALTATAPAAIRLLAKFAGYWPGADVTPGLVTRFGDPPDETALERAVELWRLSGNKITNWLGIADWYDELRRRPDWTPQDRFKRQNGQQATPNTPAVKLKEIAPGLY